MFTFIGLPEMFTLLFTLKNRVLLEKNCTVIKIVNLLPIAKPAVSMKMSCLKSRKFRLS